MTAKRFTVKTIEEELYPMPIYYDVNKKLGYVEIIVLLNELYEENQILKKELLWWKYRCGEDIGESDRMIEKRFTITDDGILDTVRLKQSTKIKSSDNILDPISFTYLIDVVNFLNELHEENEALKSSNLEYEDALGRLEEENEQLKNKIDVLEDDNETYHKSLEKLNLYTNRFIPTKCTNEFKDCKTNRYYWLDHEGNFEGCLELLNLLDCERELLELENRQLKEKK